MKRLFVLLAALAAVQACGSPGEGEPIRLRPPLPPEAPAVGPAAAPDAWDALAAAAPVEEAEGTVFVSAEEAKKCPTVRLTTSMGREVKVGPGSRGFVESGQVTLIVFWNADLSSGRYAARHVSDLAKRYRSWRVRAVGVVERTRGAGASRSFASEQGLALALYFDDLSALERMADRIGAEQETAVPSIFIVDRQMRLRFFRPGFRFM
ncbi:MAG: thioredoxin domain-containing protein, partial [Planctomycetota bacterium]